MNMKNLCVCCSGPTHIRPIYDRLPYSSAVLDREYRDSLPSASFVAAVCENCKHITNVSNSRSNSEYSDDRYVVKSAVSGAMSTNLQTILDFITKDIRDFRDLSVLEIGSGSGEVANWFAEKGAAVVTVDPAIAGYSHGSITHYQINFDENIFQYVDRKFHLILGRHILEHTENPRAFLETCSQLLYPKGTIYIELPDLISTLDHARLIDFFNDHIQHFSENSLRLLAQQQGLESIKVTRWLNGAHLGMMLSHNNTMSYENQPDDLDIAKSLDKSEKKLNQVIQKMAKFNRIALYGAGAHANTFVNQLSSDTKNLITTVFDRSSSKQGRYLPGLSAPIVAPGVDELADIDLVVNTSVLYINEVEEYLTKQLGWTGTILHL